MYLVCCILSFVGILNGEMISIFELALMELIVCCIHNGDSFLLREYV
jgi:hypothetical protein